MRFSTLIKNTLTLSLLFCAALVFAEAKPKYIFLFIGDGMSTPQRMVAEEFARASGYGTLAINNLPYQATTRTCSSSSLITDSAAAATAIACGEKTYNGALGLNAEGERIESSAEVAHKRGKKVGLTTTVTICHATPGGFYAHRKHRSLSYQIGLDLVASGFDYFSGGGFAGKANDTKDPEYKGDIYDLAKAAGYKVIRNKAESAEIKPGDKVLASYANGYMQFDMDRTDDEPSLAEMTADGIRCLDNPDGFFYMVEGGQIDSAGHANDAAPNMRDVLAFDKAVKVALDFREKHPDETLVICTGDHETGGMAMGFEGTGYAFYMDRLVNQKCSTAVFAGKYKKAKAEKPDFSFEDAKAMLHEYYGFVFDNSVGVDDKAAGGKFAKHSGKEGHPMQVTANELAVLEDAYAKGKLPDAARRLISAKSGIGWSSGAHTALPVLTTAIGVGAEKFTGFIDNTDISKKVKELL